MDKHLVPSSEYASLIVSTVSPIAENLPSLPLLSLKFLSL
jgi:hypothetical protein